MALDGVLDVGGERYAVTDLNAAVGTSTLERLPYSLRVLLEGLVRRDDGAPERREAIATLSRFPEVKEIDPEIAFAPGRVLLQDFTGVPLVVDLAALRDALQAHGVDPSVVEPVVPAELVIDHSVQVDAFGETRALSINTGLDLLRNRERYALLRWGQEAFRRVRVVAPGLGICHQVNLEHLARVVIAEGAALFPDTLVGTDSHTPMVNALGVLGWGVGGIEAEAVLLGEPIAMRVPEVVGVELVGHLREGGTATDVVLTVTETLRARNLVGKFVEFFGLGVQRLSLPDRATLANMAPEYGATVGFFPVDDETLAYLRQTGRQDAHIARVEAYCRAQHLFRSEGSRVPTYSEIVQIDLGAVEPSIAGPSRPQDRATLSDARRVYRHALRATIEPTPTPRLARDLDAWEVDRGSALAPSPRIAAASRIDTANVGYSLRHGAVVIAAITSCTNTSNPAVMIAAGLLAKNAVSRGLSVPPWVKTSLAPGSTVVMDYLGRAGLTPYLEALGFHLVAFGCTTCIGNSGPLPLPVEEAVRRDGLVVAAVLSGNRNFEGRIAPDVRMSFLASPPLVVAYALAGSMDVDLTRDPLGHSRRGEPVFLRDVWPADDDVRACVADNLRADPFRRAYASIDEATPAFRALSGASGPVFSWEAASTYVRKPPFLDGVSKQTSPLEDIVGARVLALLGDMVTTDHISPAGLIPVDGSAGRYLLDRGVKPEDFNAFGARRGNHEVMVRGTFANVRLRNFLVAKEGGVTLHLPDGELLPMFDAAERYRAEGVPLIVIAGSAYGSGSSRDWAAKGTKLLGVRAVVATSFERIHRGNLVGMGVLPLSFDPGTDARSLGLTGRERFTVEAVAAGVSPRQRLRVRVTDDAGAERTFGVTARIETPDEAEHFRHGGILPFVFRKLAA